MEKKRGRPLMSSEERELKRIVRNKRENERKKALAWKDQKNYRERHRGEYYEPKIRISRVSKPTFDSLLASTGKTITELVLDALEKQYGVNLHADITDQTHDIPTHQADE